ncbi:hypothetical protein [Micromonospora sp. WMMD1082]|uniref:deoxynucleotide monophosphate kinase family protein n=1 Tax=Micromonospora sp. WMMD1082 TaxID=3016104 RepID=UPI0024171E1B|nr:hypothetical protein [Micromonospora sp. WMMD1082]MDG4792713.1 hypothetical protein [Micromonospora sp. WMMD1082]
MTYPGEAVTELIEATFSRRPARPPLIGVMGKKRAGKDTIAARLVEAHGFRQYAFADALRECALIADPIVTPLDTVGRSLRLSDVVSAVGWEEAKAHREVRRTLQQFGVSVRHLDPHFWVRVVMDEVAHRSQPVVITDVRFPNEADAIEAAGGVLWRVTRPGQDESDQHISETALSGRPAHAALHNRSDLHSLLKEVDRLASRL